VSLLATAGVGREQQVGPVPVEAQLGPRFVSGTGAKAVQVGAAGQDGASAADERQAAPAAFGGEQGPRNPGSEVGPAGEAPRERPDQAVPHVGAVEGDDQRVSAGEPGAPAGETVMRVDEVESRSSQQRPEPPRRRDVLLLADREAEELDLDTAAADLTDLVPHPAPALRGLLVGLEVGYDEHPHRG
jgi:hypothetical protein